MKGLPNTKLDAAWGLTGLVSLYLIRSFCVYFSKKYPRRGKYHTNIYRNINNIPFLQLAFFFFVSVLRNAFVVIVLTIAAWLYCRSHKLGTNKYPIKILLTVPSGFKHIAQPNLDPALLSALAPELPVSTIILLLEHIAISKCK